MEKVKIRFLVICALFAFMSVSCSKGDDIENKQTMASRVQDGKGKVFLENGTLVDANINYTQEQLIDALSRYEWECEYSFYYDNHNISSRTEINYLPTIIYTDGTLKSSLTPYYPWSFSVSGKKMTTVMIENVISSAAYPPMIYTVISLDLSNNSGRMVMDYKTPAEVTGFDSNSLYARMVWKAIIP